MKKILFLLVTVGYSLSIAAQEKPTKNEFLEINKDKSITFYLGKGLRLSNIRCADFYLVATIAENNFELKDSIKIFNSNNNLVLTGNFANGKKNGHFSFYHKNGKLECAGLYENDLKKGNWNYYYPDGKLKKVINYGNEYALLIDFYDKNGQHLVENGNGNYIDELNLYYTTQTKSTVKGTVVDGALDGKWEIYTANIKTGTEYFKKKKFIKGISHSSLVGDVKYTDNYYSTFVDANNLEVIKLSTPPNCIKNYNERKTLDTKLFESIKTVYSNSELKKKLENGWFFVELKFDNFGQHTIRIFSLLDSQTDNEIIKMISLASEETMNFSNNKNTTFFFPVVIQSGNAFLPTDPGFSLMSRN